MLSCCVLLLLLLLLLLRPLLLAPPARFCLRPEGLSTVLLLHTLAHLLYPVPALHAHSLT